LEDIIKRDFKEILCECADWIELAQVKLGFVTNL
jgi:hypothetical protein